MSKKVQGNTRGLAPNQKKQAEKLYERAVDKSEIVSLSFARELYALAQSLGRRVGVLISREGVIEEVFIGSREILYLPDLGRYRLDLGRLRRLRLVYSDLSRQEDPQIPSDIYGDLEKLRLDMVVSVKNRDNHCALSFAYNVPIKRPEDRATMTEFVPDLGSFDFDFLEFISGLEAELDQADVSVGKKYKNPGLLIGVYPKSFADPEGSLRELKELAKTAGIDVVDEIIQHRKPDPRTLLGKGKLEEIVLIALRLGVELLIFDTELRPSQWRVITNATELKVLDRSMVILDIFAQRATSSDGRLQVELAQLKYNLPRLVEKDVGLSRLTGGIGGRGPGETKLEIGRRRIRDRIANLDKKIDKLGSRRHLRRSRRQSNAVPLVSILGYTNAGKSTLFNTLTGSKVLAEDKLFATLDPSQGKLFVPFEDPERHGGLPLVLSDTVGFIRNLPDELANAFRATLEELYDASLLLHVVDSSSIALHDHIATVKDILLEMEIGDIPLLYVFNKIDCIEDEDVEHLCREYGGIGVSALNDEGLEELKQAVVQLLTETYGVEELPFVDYS